MAAKAGRRIGQVVSLLGGPHRPVQLRKAIRAAQARGHATPGPGASIKYIGDYLSLGLTRPERFESIQHHYRFLAARTPHVAIDRGIAIWRSVDDEGRVHDVIMQPSFMAPMEGEAELCFRVDGEWLFTLSFSIVDGGMVGGDGAAAFVGGIQGAYFARERVRYAARKNGEIAPPAMLLLAMDAVADALEIATIAGTSTAAHVSSVRSVDGRSSTFDYDTMWQRSGGIADGRGHFRMPVGAPAADGGDIAGTHRARTRRRRKKRAEIRAAMLANIATAFGSGDAAPSGRAPGSAG